MYTETNSPDLKKRQESGLSMIELLVSIGIISVMSTFFFAGVREVRTRAKIQHCQNNLRELGMAFDMYDVHWTGKLPPTTGPDDDNLRPLFPLSAKSLDLFVCISTGNSVVTPSDLENNAGGSATGVPATIITAICCFMRPERHWKLRL
ncbi:MAG: type II secretion system protein [Planctomycetota bacterium]|jgi:type II secretory pathway pseudopilin PulG|nr:type II secretion system protein [Planctomycetota bacterium]